MKIEIEAEALDSLKAMVQRLQDERDDILNHLEDLITYAPDPTEYSTACVYSRAREAIAKFTAKPEVM